MLIVLCASCLASAQPPGGDTAGFRFGNVFNHFGENVRESFLSPKILFHLSGAGLTWWLVNNNADYNIHHHFNTHATQSAMFDPIVVTGTIIPFAIGIPLWYAGAKERDVELFQAGSAVLQASLITALYVGTVKAFTGRPHPPDDASKPDENASKDFRSGFWRSGIIQGWPSGHSAATAAVMSTLIAYYPEKPWLKIGGYTLMAYTLVGVSAAKNGTMHWFSDGVAGIVSGYAIGSTVGQNFRKSLSGDEIETGSRSIGVIPIAGMDFVGAAFYLEF